MGVEVMGPLAQTLFGTGAVGAILVWFMFRNEANIKDLTLAIRDANKRSTEAQDRQTRAVLLLMVSNPHMPHSTIAQAQEVIKETDDAEAQRKANA